MTNNVKTYEFKDNSKRQRYVIGSFKAYLAVTLFVLVMTVPIAVMLSLNGPNYQYEHDKLVGLIYMVSDLSLIVLTLVYYISGICFFFWLYRASCNMHALSPETKFKFTPKWNIASYFIPFVCLVWPYQALKELWNNTKSVSSQLPEKTVLIWWVSFLCYIIFKRAATGFSIGEGFQNIKWFSILMIPTAILGLLSCYKLLGIVKDVQQK